MRSLLAFFLALLLPLNAFTHQVPTASVPPPSTTDAKAVLEDATPVKLRLSRNVSSADAHVGDTVDFEVLEEVKVGDVLVIPKGGVAWGTVTAAVPKRRMARGGKVDMTVDNVRLVSGEKAALRAVKEAKGGGHTGAMTGGIVATGLLFFPAAPFFLFMHGKDITIPKGAEITAYVNGNFNLDPAKFAPQTVPTVGAQAPGALPQAPVNSQLVAPLNSQATLEISSTPPGADIELDGSFIGNTPSSVAVSSGDHIIKISKSGYGPWERKLKASTGNVRISPELQPVEAGAAK